jgi:hypothetical protein
MVMTTRLQRWKTIGAVAGFMWGAIACRAIVGIEDITDNGGGDGGLSDRSMTTDGPTHDAKADSHHPSDAKADVVTTDTGTHDAGHDAGVDAHVRSPLFFAWVTSIDGGTPDGAVAVASDAGFTSYLQPYVVYPLEDGWPRFRWGARLPYAAFRQVPAASSRPTPCPRPSRPRAPPLPPRAPSWSSKLPRRGSKTRASSFYSRLAPRLAQLVAARTR